MTRFAESSAPSESSLPADNLHDITSGQPRNTQPNTNQIGSYTHGLR